MPRISSLRSVASLALQVTVLLALVAAFFFRAPQVSGLSMSPQIAPGEFVLIDTLTYRFRAPQRGDIIAFRHDGDEPETFIKRVIGLGGDRVRIERGTVFVNGARLDESYVRYPDTRTFAEITVPAGDLYVLGDNRAQSDDSRFFGTIDRNRVIGRAVAAVWPLDRFGTL